MSHHPSAAIANEFLQRAWNEGRSLTHMHVQKLVYIAHGWNWAVNNEPLIDEPFKAWDYGPVADTLFKALRRYGPGNITRLIRRGDDTIYTRDDGEAIMSELSPEEREIIDQIWSEFKDFKAFQLSELTHKVGSPWHEARKSERRNEVIAESTIQDYFARLADAP